ncbi:MAG: PfkB family carbohydrate kinase [Promicromonosporaceae bacterium]|nr:PfkB family carbohydrate kinase [Promicromonosporaceae bacterium]
MTTCWFVGLTTLDVIHRAASPRRNQKVTASSQEIAAGGPAANAAVTAAALGARAVLISAVGASPQAEIARRDLAAHDVTLVDVDPGFVLPISAVLIDDQTGERSVVSPDAALQAAPRPSTAALNALPPPDAVMFDGHHPEIARGVLAHLDGLHPRPLVVLDAGRWRPVFSELIPAADVVAASADFRVPAPAALGGPGEAGQASPTARVTTGEPATAWVTTNGAGPVRWRSVDPGADTSADAGVATTRGIGAAMAGATTGASGEVRPPAVVARDTLGAGDAFHGALVAALAAGDTLAAAVERAVAVASTRVQHAGPRGWLAALPDTSDLGV